MVFVWSNLVDGEPHFTLSQVALNDLTMVIAFAPIVGLLLGLSSITVPWDTLLLSVVLYIVVPVIAAQAWRAALLRMGGPSALARTLAPLSLAALLLTLVLLFGLQGEQIARQPLIILLLYLSNLVFAAGLALMAAVTGPAILTAAWLVVGAGMALGLYDSAFNPRRALWTRRAGRHHRDQPDRRVRQHGWLAVEPVAR
jgi:ACR3 family arsenite transporter